MNPVIIEKMWVGETDDQNWPKHRQTTYTKNIKVITIEVQQESLACATWSLNDGGS